MTTRQGLKASILPEVEPERLYGLAAACRLIPSARARHIGITTLKRWLKARLLKPVKRRGPFGRTQLFIRGADILSLFTQDETVREYPISRKEADRRHAAAIASLRSMGCKVPDETPAHI